MSSQTGSPEGLSALCGSDIPSASIAEAMVLAVYMPPHDPAPGLALASTASSPASSSGPAARAPTASKTSLMSMSRPSRRPGRMVPP